MGRNGLTVHGGTVGKVKFGAAVLQQAHGVGVSTVVAAVARCTADGKPRSDCIYKRRVRAVELTVMADLEDVGGELFARTA